jgi:alpha-L-rhamnosidase
MGATSLTEAWNGSPRASQDHFMLGQINEWFFRSLAGIQVDPAALGFRRIVIRPALVDEVTWVNARYESIRGEIACSWRRGGTLLKLDVTIPVNTTATVYVPAVNPGSVMEGGRAARFEPGVRFIRMEAGRAMFAVGSGHYAFSSRTPAGYNP